MRRKPPLPYVQAFGGYYYFRRAGFPRVRLPGLLFSPEFMAAYQEAMALAPAPVGVSRSKPGSVAATVAAYLASTQFAGLAAGSQVLRRQILQRFRNDHGDKPIALLPAKFIAVVVGRLKPHAARSYFQTIRALCQFAVATELIKIDPTAGMKVPRPKTERRRPWTAEEIAQYEATHPIGTKARLAFALGLYTLQRRGDVIRMGRQHIRNGMLAVTQEKTGVTLSLPVRPELRAVIEGTPSKHLTFLVTRTGKQFTGSIFSEQFRVWCKEASLPVGCTFHGLRASGCTILADAGCSTHEIAAWSGHMTLKEVERYTKAADQKRLAGSALAKVTAAAWSTEQSEHVDRQTVEPRLSKPLK
jgi:integrase